MRHYPRQIQTRRASIAVGKGHVFNHGVGDQQTKDDRGARYGRAAATGTLVSAAAWTDTTTVVVGDVTYTILATLVDAANNVLKGANEAATLLNLSRAINASGGSPGTDYGTATVANPKASAVSDGVHTITVTSRKLGPVGNRIALSASADAIASGALLTGGC